MTKVAIKNLIAQDQLGEAIEHLMTLVNAYLLKEKDADVLKIQHALIVNSGKFKEWEKDSRLGILERREEQTTIAQIRTAVLYAVEALPDQFWITPDPAKLPKQPIKPTEPKEQNTKQTANLDLVKNSSLLLNFYQTHGEHATTTQFFQLQNAIEKEFGFISDLDLDDLIAAVAVSERKQWEVLNVHIPQTIKTFVAEHRGKWSRRDELLFLEELGKHFDQALDKPTFAQKLEEAKEYFLKTWQDFVFIKGGTFTMGAPAYEPDSLDHERPQHQVQVSDFYLSKCPVTLAQFEAFILATGYQTDADKDGGSNFWTGSKWDKKAGINWSYDVNGNLQQDKQHPVIHVSWNDAKAYCEWLAQKLNLNVRLPREAEWEYACRAGTNTPFNTGENLTTEQANYNGNFPYTNFPKGTYLGNTSPVGAYPANEWGLYDLHGNVWEWCEDWYSETWYEECKKQGIVHDPTGPSTGSARVLRGGSWGISARRCRAAYRDRGGPEDRYTRAGFRPVVSL